MTRIAHFDLASGASGDMIIAALADAGRRIGIDVENAVARGVERLGLGCSVTFVDDERGGFACVRAEVKVDDRTHSPDRLRSAIEDAAASDAPKRRALAGLDALVAAESRVHGVDSSDVHLHELGSADTAADLLGSAVAFDALGIDRVTAGPVPVPSGWIKAGSHGELPLPAPVTLTLLEGAKLRGVDTEHELVTPTGAAILLAHDTTYGTMPELTLHAAGVGGGSRITDRPNISRVLIGESAVPGQARLETCVLLEANIDDQTPEALAHAVDLLLRDRALDAWVTPIVMKKSRPAFQLAALVAPADEAHVAGLIFRHTTTIGLRRRETTRWALARRHVVVSVAGEDIRVKVASLDDDVVNVAPEFDDCSAAAARTGLPIKDIYAEAQAAARALTAQDSGGEA